jgi:DUF1365 family protein
VTASAIYEGWVSHRRLEPRPLALRHRIWMALLDLAELPQALDHHPLWSARRPAPVRFRQGDFLDAGDRPLAEVARDLAAERLGSAPDGPIRVLAMPRFAGLGFNPASLVYLHGADGGLEALIVEVTNTPWGDRHRYVADGAGGRAGIRARLPKRLHVSPFMPMDQGYLLEASAPSEGLRVRVASEERGRLVFEARLALRRRELSAATMRRVMLRYPPPALATLARIYAHAARLWLARVPVHPRPSDALR